MSELPVSHPFADREALDAQLAADVAAQLREAIIARGQASLVVSGGSTPRGFFRLLAQQDIDWKSLVVSLADERWVQPHHRDSNERLVRENLLAGSAAEAQFVSLVTRDSHPAAAVKTVEARLEELGRFDVTMLGMGTDGHFASLFPGSSALEAGLGLANPRSCIAVDPPEAVHARMSLTLRRLLDSRTLILHIVGDEKRAVLERAAAQSDAMALPIAAVLASGDPALRVYWAP